MNQLIIDNHVIKKDIRSILSLLQLHITNGKLHAVKYGNLEVAVTCPFHNEGKESHPSCFIYVGEDDKTPWGTFHCFSCNESGNLVKFIGAVLDVGNNYACKWLKDNFTEDILRSAPLEIDDSIPPKQYSSKGSPKYLNESVLDKLQSWHPYIAQRHISREVAERFQVKYDPKNETVVFPVRDTNDNLVFLTRRSIKEKRFYIDERAEKTVYLLNEAIKDKCNQIIVVESQINALVSYSYGFPAIALFGAGTTQSQIDELNKTNILHYILMYDNDDAGRKGACRFKKLIKDSVFVTDIIMPKGKDVADCSKEEFYNILRKYQIEVDSHQRSY